MPYLVHEGCPVRMSWSRFIREPYLIKKRFVLTGLPAHKARRVRPTAEKRAFKEFFIHLGRYDLDPAVNQQKIERHGLPVAATLDSELIGAVNSFNLWVHPAYTKKGLAVEMIVDRFRYTGDGAGRHFSEPDGPPMRYTPEGFAALRAGFLEIVKRGLIDPGPEGLPT